MYTDEKRRGSLLKDFISKLILIIIFVLLLIWLVPWPNMDSLNPLKDQIFNSNLQTMKEAGISYFTTERLPEEVGDKTTLTLQKMLDMKLLIPFTDRNGKSCDVKKSYVSLEKKETEYLMKVNLKCSEEEDYILVHLGCYSYCTTDICEAKPGSTEKPTTKPVVAKPTATSTTKPTSTPTVKPTTTPTTKPTVKPTPTTKPTVKPTPTTKPTPTVKPTPTTKPTPTVVPENKECEWKKDIPKEYSAWSNWVEKVYDSSVVFELTDTKETVDLGTRSVLAYTIDPIYEKVPFKEEIQQKVGTHTFDVCEEYDYEYDQKTIARIDSDWKWADAWWLGDNRPDATIDERWIFIGVKYDDCSGKCTNHPVSYYRKQTRKVTVYNEISNVVAQCKNVVTREIPIYITRTKTSSETVLVKKEQKVYEDKRFYKFRTRTVLHEATTDYKWIDCNSSLKADGYTATGKTRTAK